jgi:hypothetical protein
MPTITSAAHRAASGGARARASDCPRFRHLVGRVWRLGPRPTAELLLEVAADHGALIRRLERYARIDPALVEAADARDWLEPRALVRIIDKTEGAGRPW